MLITALLLLFAYLLGSVSGSLLLGRFRGVDIRTQGSGNAGGTNAFRTQGVKFALGVVLIDIGKGAFCAWLALRFAPLDGPFSPRALAFTAAFIAAIGHVWPLWHGFRGGKGVGTLLGGVAVLLQVDAPTLWFSIAAALLVLFTHRVNVQRLRAGTESRFERVRFWRRRA